MHLLDQRILGGVILALLALLVAVKRLTTGNIIRDVPDGGVLLWLVHVFNLFFLLVVIPIEEDGLRQAYGDQYVSHSRRVRRLVPFVY